MGGYGDKCMTSTDGITWTARDMPSLRYWYRVTFGAGIFVATAEYANVIATSPDGVVWTQRTITQLAANAGTVGAAYGAGVFVITGDTGNPKVFTSTDGVVWTERQALLVSVWDIALGNGVFVTVPSTGYTGYATSTDGITWVSRQSPNGAQRITFGLGRFVVAEENTNTRPRCAISKNGIDWVNGLMPSGYNWNWQGITNGNGYFFVVSAGNHSAAAVSRDGLSWELKGLYTTAGWNDAMYTNNAFVFFGYNRIGRLPVDLTTRITETPSDFPIPANHSYFVKIT
jgi:hypothetical protein